MASLVRTHPDRSGPSWHFLDGKPITAERYDDLLHNNSPTRLSTKRISVLGGFLGWRHRCEVRL